MSRTIIDVSPAGSAGEFIIVRESVTGGDPGPGEVIKCKIPNGGTQQGHTGDLVYTLLSGAAPAVQKELDFQPAQGAPPAPIYINDLAPRAQELPWEMLRHSSQGFFALEGKRPLARIVEPTSGGDRKVTDPLYDPPLKVLAIISAAGIDGENEWRQLYGGLKSHEAQTPFRLHTLYAEDSVKQAIEEKNDPAVTTERLHSDDPLVSRYDEMIADEISRFQPHVLHFFCHGMPSETPELELATVMDKAAGRERGLIKLDANYFESLLKEVTCIWCVILNCCHGATRRESSSLARRLMEFGVPVSIGMREAVQPNDANVFCGEFYRELSNVLEKSFANNETEELIEWAMFLTEPRRKICTERVGTLNDAEQIEEWAHPVIYLKSQPFFLKLQTAGIGEEERENLLGELVTLRDSKQELLQAGIGGEVIAKIDERILELVDKLSASGGTSSPSNA